MNKLTTSELRLQLIRAWQNGYSSGILDEHDHKYISKCPFSDEKKPLDLIMKEVDLKSNY